MGVGGDLHPFYSKPARIYDDPVNEDGISMLPPHSQRGPNHILIIGNCLRYKAVHPLYALSFKLSPSKGLFRLKFIAGLYPSVKVMAVCHPGISVWEKKRGGDG